MVTKTAEGVFLIHEPDQRPVEGVAVYRYSYAWGCEKDGTANGTTRGYCGHVQMAIKEEDDA